MSFALLYVAGFAVLSQLPLVMIVINSIKELEPKKLLGGTKWMVLGSFIIAAIITPTPDPFNQFIIAGPIIALYLLSIGIIKLINNRQPSSTQNTKEAPDIKETKPTQDKLDISQFKIVKRQESTHNDRKGQLCLGDLKDRSTNKLVVTFLYQGKHTYLRTINKPTAKRTRSNN